MIKIEQRFWSKVDPLYADKSCWNWIGVTDKNGYGQIRLNGRLTQAHRFSWELWRWIIPHGICVLHKCDNPSCVRPGHLFLGTKSDNTRDAISKGRFRPPNGINITHCKRGHEFSKHNTDTFHGSRVCKECNRFRMRQYLKRKRDRKIT